MLGKLIKHDFRAFSRTLLPMQIGVLAGGVLAAILTRLIILMTDLKTDGLFSSGLMTLFGVLAGLMIGVLMLAIASSALVTLILICTRVQRSFFDDEGYLTFSLPTTTGRLLWSKIITGTLWMLINVAVIALTMFLYSAFGTAQGTIANVGVLEGVGRLFSGFGDLFGAVFAEDAPPAMWLMVILAVLDVLAYALLQILALYFAVIAGGSSARRHRLLAAIGVYLAVKFCMGILVSVFGVSTVATMVPVDPLSAVWTTLVAALAVFSGLSAALFCWSRHLLKNKLNLQ